MEIKNEIKFRLALIDKLTSACASYLGVHIDDDSNVFIGDNVFEPYDCETIGLSKTIPYDNDLIDSVLMFGDGTIEFHLQDSQEAFNWNEFNNEIIIIILKQILKLNK